MSFFFRLRHYIYYQLFSHDEYGIHSPFVYEFYTRVIKDNKDKNSFAPIENLRDELLKTKNKIAVCDYGTGSKKNPNQKRKISSIASTSLKQKKYARLLFRIIQYYEPDTALDLGTSLGITTLYQSLAMKSKSGIFTFDGCEESLKIAKKNFNELNQDIISIAGNLDNTFPDFLQQINKIDYVFLDANHTLDATIRYFTHCLTRIHQNTILIFDDIHHSEEMNKAWNFIKNHKDVKQTIDLFQMGIVLFRENQPKQHFMLKY